jgi:FdhD protein
LLLLVEVRSGEEAMDHRGTKQVKWWDLHRDWEAGEGEVIEEITLTIYLNGRELVSLMGTPLNQDWLAVGFLKSEGIISDRDEILDLKVTRDGCCVDVWLSHGHQLPVRRIFTSGCGGGLTFEDPAQEIEPFPVDAGTTPEQLLEAFNQLQKKDSLYARARGVHAAGLLDLREGNVIAAAEDIGRHNAIDKLWGACLLQDVPTQNQGLLTTGRISSEMLRKGALMGCPLIASRSSPTSLAAEMAEAWQITLIGYARQGQLRVYSYPERLGYKADMPDRT